jgi:Xaa-Pro aminopeptidase
VGQISERGTKMTKTRISQLVALFEQHEIEGYIVPSSDEYQNEYVPDCAKRLEYITGFSGSNGMCILKRDKGLFFTDGRYLEQSKQQLDTDYFQIFDLRDISKILPSLISPAQTIGYDPKLFTKQTLKIFEGVSLKQLAVNLVDKVWIDKPHEPDSRIYIYADEFAGETYASKLESCKEVLSKHRAEALVITSPDSICWLLNLRASDVEFSPLMLARAVIFTGKTYLFIDLLRVDETVKKARPLIDFLPASNFEDFLRTIKGKVLIDENLASIAVAGTIKNTENITDPCKMLKARKNEVEIKHAIDGHVHDAVAVCEFLSFIASNDLSALTEYDLGLKLIDFRKVQPGYVYDSFPVICGFKENGAVIHYRANVETAKKIGGNGLLLVDSGGQYFKGTTDITRTVAIGEPTAEEKHCYTLVLQGHIELSSTKFARGVSGANLEILARKFLWAKGLDYPHSTGHGVGSFLSVHEGPQGISLKNNVPLEKGMILSNEPGYYVPGKYGIRIENLMYVKESDHLNFLEFENLTLVPYAKELIDFNMLERRHLEYLRQYYQKIRDLIYDLLSIHAKKWFDRQTTI